MNDLMIKYFMTVAKCQSFTKASELLFTSQPSISKRISALEEELGFTLFARNSKPISLTEIGKLYYNLFLKFYDELEKTNQRAQKINNENHGSISVAFLNGWDISRFFPVVMNTLNKKYPKIKIELESREFNDLNSSLELGLNDIIITLDSILYNMSENVCVSKLTKIPSIILYSQNHPLAKSKNLLPIDFKDETFYASASEGAEAFVKKVCKSYGFIPKVQTVLNINTQINRVQNGLGVAINDYWTFSRFILGFNYIKLDSFHDISMAWKKDNCNPALSLFINELLFIFNSSLVNEILS